MARRYSAVSNYAIGQVVRMVVVGVIGFALARGVSILAGVAHTQEDANFSA